MRGFAYRLGTPSYQAFLYWIKTNTVRMFWSSKYQKFEKCDICNYTYDPVTNLNMHNKCVHRNRDFNVTSVQKEEWI